MGLPERTYRETHGRPVQVRLGGLTHPRAQSSAEPITGPSTLEATLGRLTSSVISPLRLLIRPQGFGRHGIGGSAGFRVSLSKSFVHAASLREVGLLPLTCAASLCPPSSHPAYISFRV